MLKTMQRQRRRQQLEAARAREAGLVARVKSFPVTTESLAIARHLQAEGFYTRSTKLPDIARRVEAIRR